MDVVGSEIGQKMRSAIKAKLTELGCYVDDELPDYVMVMVANKRTQLQMEDDLQLFLGDNTELFVDWLHQVLKKLQEVTVAVPLKMDKDKAKERSVSKERKSKDKKEKDKTKKTDVFKKSKKKDKEKFHHKKEKKVQKNKKDKKSKSHERIRPNIPPLLMNMEKDSEPSITDVFAGQILKNHGVNLDVVTDDAKIVEIKPNIKDKRPILPVIDPASILEPESNSVESSELPKDSQLKEINYIEAKIQGLKQKLVQQLDSLSDDEDFLTIRTEAEELMNDFAEDVLQEISEPTDAAPILNDPSQKPKRTQNPEPPENAGEIPERPTELPVDASGQDTQEVKKQVPGEALPQIELKLPKRPVRERLGGRGAAGAGGGGQVASVVRVRPRPRAAPSSSLLLRAVADAHKSLLAAPPPPPPPRPALQRALVLPMRRRKPDLVPARTATSTQDSLVIETINIHNTTVDKDKDTQFIVTMDGYHPNAFLAKKLMTEGLLDDEAASETLKTPEAPKEAQNVARDVGDGNKAPDAAEEMNRDCKAKEAPISSAISPKKRLSDTSEDSDTQVIIKKEHAKGDRRQGSDASGAKETQPPAAKKRRASPIVFDVDKKESRDAARPKAASAKYDSVPPLWGARCRAFPSCRFGASCVFGHPRCRFAASCTRRGCLYAHDAHKPALPSPCKFYPKCANAACPFLHPKPCRFGKACANRLQCGFFHADDPANAYPL